jgi:hypothetical protein
MALMVGAGAEAGASKFFQAGAETETAQKSTGSATLQQILKS